MQAWDKLYGIVTSLEKEKEKKTVFKVEEESRNWSLTDEVFEYAIQSQGKVRAFYFMAVVGFNNDCC